MQTICRDLGITDYKTTLEAMQVFTKNRTFSTPDELWLTMHNAVYTLGLNRTDLRLPSRADIPIVQTDRGGKITYHGLGQVVIYCLLDLKRSKHNVRELVNAIEASIVSLLASHHVTASTQKNAPGVYVNGAKIASLGLRLKNQCCYHGLSLNVAMDLTPFSAIDPCGYQGLKMTQTSHLGIEKTPQQIGEALLKLLQENLTP